MAKMSARPSVEVPQATLARLRTVVDTIAGGALTQAEIEIAAKASGRHVQYAMAALAALGLVEPDRVRLTAAGRRLAGTQLDSEDERSQLAAAIRASRVMSVVAPGLLDPVPPSRERLREQLQAVAGLGPETADHRAGMLLQWRRTLLDPQKRLFRAQGMWRRIEIKNFRSIESATVDLAPFTIVVGPNGSGKSNFADALVFARDIALDAVAAISSRGGIVGVRRWRPSKPTDVMIEVRAAKSKADLQLNYAVHSFKVHSAKAGEWRFTAEHIAVIDAGVPAVSLDRKENAIQGRPHNIADRPEPTASAMVVAKQLKSYARTSPLRNIKRYRLNPDEMRKPQLEVEEKRLADNGANIATAIRAIASSGKLRLVVEPMAKIVPGLKDIFVEQAGRYMVLKFKQRQGGHDVADFQATEMSEGALRALGIIVATHQMERDELLIVEEPEVSIHAGAAGLLFDVLKEASERGAVLITTHSADLLDRARDEEILVCEYREGSTVIGALARTQRNVVRQGLFSLSELMRSEPLRIEASDPPTRPKRTG